MKKGILLGIDRGVSVVEIKGDLKEYCDLLGVDCIDIVVININGVSCSIVCDDESFFKDNPIPTVFDRDEAPLIFGPILILGGFSEGDPSGLTPEEISRIYACIAIVNFIGGDSRSCILGAIY